MSNDPQTSRTNEQEEQHVLQEVFSYHEEVMEDNINDEELVDIIYTRAKNPISM